MNVTRHDAAASESMAHMDLASLYKKLIAAARASAPGDRVPHAFEKRVAALIASRVALQNLDWWVRGLWRAAVSCIVVALLLGAWALLNPAPASGSTDLSQNLETTLLASVDQANQQAP